MNTLKDGWVEGSVQDFLELSNADMEYIETRLSLRRRLRAERMRQQAGLTAPSRTRRGPNGYLR